MTIITFDNKYEARCAATEGRSQRSSPNLVAMLGVIAGKRVVETISWGEVDREGEDGIYAIIMDDGSGIMVEYSGEERGYSEHTPGSPASVDYYILTPKQAKP